MPSHRHGGLELKKPGAAAPPLVWKGTPQHIGWDHLGTDKPSGRGLVFELLWVCHRHLPGVP